MLDIKKLRDNLEDTIKRLNTRGQDYSYLRDIVALDDRRKELVQEVEQYKNHRNEKSKLIGQLKREGKEKEIAETMKVVDIYSEDIKKFDEEIIDIEKQIFEALANTPNVPRETIPVGKSEDDNVCMRKVGDVPKFNFEPKKHYEIAEELELLDFEVAGKITGSRFVMYKGLGARLERAIINFFLDLHVNEHGFTEYLPPFMVNSNTMFGTGQLPKFEEDMFGIVDTDYWLIPTSEVPLTNYYANEIMIKPELPMKFTAYTPCFRREAGSAGRDTRGLIRQHQFNKVEMVMYAHPDKSYDALDALTGYAEKALQLLELPYQVLQLCTADIGFSAAQTNDLEVWMPGFETYREISSCSNCEDFQARRANIKFKDDEKGKAEFVHTLNGSGLAIGRTFAAILENYQTEDGEVIIPKVLVPYMGGIEKISK